MDRDFGLAEDQREVIAAVRAWVVDRAAPVAAGHEERAEFPRALFRELGAMGLAGIPYDEAYGGGGQSFLTTWAGPAPVRRRARVRSARVVPTA